MEVYRPMIWLNGMGKIFGRGGERHEIFHDVNLLIPSGLVIGILGDRASGKSTLLKLIAGAELPSEGSIHVEGTTLWSGGISASQHASMTVRQNLRFLCRLYTENDVEMEEQIQKILELAELSPYKETLWREVPSTHKSLLGPAAMTVLESDYLLLDGFPSRKKSSRIFEAMKKRILEKSTLMTTSNTKNLRKYCDAAIVIQGKNLHYFDQVNEAIKFYRNESKK
jgi:capsular polysaccharide transport system ATP-binding protein